MGLKTGDQFTVPLCRKHHDELHHTGESLWWAMAGINAICWATKKYEEWVKDNP